MFEDPKTLTAANWQDIHIWLQFFWIYFPLIVTFAVTILTAHAIIPSLINSKHAPESLTRLRTPLTGFAFLVLAAAVVMMVMVIINTLNVAKFWDRWLI